MADWGDAFSEIGKDLSSAGEAVHNWWDAFESKPSTTVPLPPATPATPAQERRFKGKTPDPKGFPVPSRADLQRQQALDNNDETGHFGDVISEAARSAIPGVVGFLGDLADTPVAAFERATGIGRPKPTLPGSGRVSRKISQLWDAFTQPDNAPVPTSKAEERASAVTQGVVSSLPFIGEAPAKVLLSGVTGGGGSQAAHEAFPNSDIAPFIGGIVGGGVPFVMPVRGRVTSGFGEREAPIAGASTYHQGIDIAARVGTPVEAPEGGVVSRVGADRKAGRWVEIDHGDGLKTKYLHLSEIHVKPGDEVSQGRVFAKTGATGNVTGPHLHWAAFKDGKAIDPRSLARDPAHPPVPPMDPAELSSAMGDPEAGIQAETGGLEQQPFLTDAEGNTRDESEFEQFKRQRAEEAFQRTAGQMRAEGPLTVDNLPEDVLTPAERQDMDASVDKPVVDNTGYERFTPYPEEKTPANDENVHSFADARQTRDLKDFHAELMSKVSDRAELQRQLTQEAKDQGLFSYDVGDRFTTTKSRENGDGPWKVIGHYVDPKDPERYGYYVERGSKEADDYERGQLLVSDPKTDAQRIGKGWGPYDRAADVQSWQKLGDVKEAPKEELVRDQNPPAASETFGTSHPEGVNRKDPTKGLKDHVPKFLLKRTEEAPPEEPEYGGGYGKSNGYRSEPPEEYPESIYRLADALKKAGPKRTEQNAAFSKERQERAAELAKVRKYTSGVEGFHAEKAALKGELAKIDFEPLSNHLSEEDVTDLMDHVKNHPNLGYLQSVTAREGLAKMLQGEVPTRNEITLLSRALPPELMKDLLKNRGWLAKSAEVAANVLNIPKTLMASYDISAPLRQGVFLIGRKEFYKALVPMVRAFASPKYERAVREVIYRDPLFPAMQDSDLAVPVYKNHNGGPALVEHEEPYMTNLAQKIPLVGIGVRASERAYNTFVYKLRADTFRAIYKAGRAADKQWTQESLKDLSRFINTFTGRGDLGKFNNAAPILNSAFFSPRLLKSRIDAINPKFYAELDPFVRKEALKSIISFAVIATTVLGLAKLSGAEVDPDIRKADGWKIKVGNTRYDILGGEQQLIRLLANVGSYVGDKAQEVATTGKIKKSYKDRTATDNIGQFLRNKESPDVSLFHDFLSGNDAVGQNFDATHAVVSRVTPMGFQDWYDAADDLRKQGVPVDQAFIEGLAKSSPSEVGISVATYPPHQKKEKKSKKKDPFDFNFDFGSEKKSRKKSGDFGDAF